MSAKLLSLREKAIYQLHSSGWSYGDLAALFHTTEREVRHARKRHWNELGRPDTTVLRSEDFTSSLDEVVFDSVRGGVMWRTADVGTADVGTADVGTADGDAI